MSEAEPEPHKEPRILRIYLDPTMLQLAREGGFGFVNRITETFEAEDFRVDLVRNSFDQRARSGARNGYSLFHMDDPFHTKALTMRKAYYYPYWRIEPTAERWDFAVAQKSFDPGEIDTDLAASWFADWRKWLFKKGPSEARKEGVIYVALQGLLAEHRSFQSMSPLEMIHAVQDYAGARKIILGLHPGETYSDAELAALETISTKDARVTVQTGRMEEALRSCDLVVTQNSTAALSGLFFGKPAALFARSDFHHLLPSTFEQSPEEAMAQAEGLALPFAAYLYWFVELNSIKADAPDAGDKILAICRANGWQI